MSEGLALLCAALISSIASIANAEQIPARVFAVADGDTITVITDQQQRQRVRIAGIDAPEKARSVIQMNDSPLFR